MEKNKRASAADPSAHTSPPDWCLHHAHAEHGLASVPGHISAAANAGYPHIGFRFHPRACGAKPRLGVPAADRRRDDGAIRLSSDHGGGLGILHRRSRADGKRAGASLLSVMLGGGVLIGISLACTAAAIAMSVAARAVPETVRSTVLGIVSAAGSLGALLSAPIGQLLNEGYGWRTGLVGFVVLSIAMLPAAWYAGKVDKIPLPPRGSDDIADTSASIAVKVAFGNASFVVMTLAYFVCGMQLVFLTTHLPSYLAICGLDPMLSAQTLGMIGGFNVLGSLFFGWAGGRWNKLALLGGIYIFRSLALAWYFTLTPSPATTLLFGAIMGFLWMGVSPLVAGAVAEMFGLQWQAMIQGLAFMSHQLGSFLGAYGGGLLYDSLGSYTIAWRIGVALGLAGGIIQVAFAFIRPTQPPLVATA